MLLADFRFGSLSSVKKAFETARFNRSRTSPPLLLHDLAEWVQEGCAVWCAELSLNPRGLGLDVRFTETTVSLGRQDRSVAEDFPQRSERASRFKPPARERVPQLVSVKPFHTGELPHLLRERITVRDREQFSHPTTQFLE